MKAIVFDRFGEPADVLQVRELPEPEPGPGEVRVRMTASPVNPSDLLYVRGRYTIIPPLPARPGFEGVGIVDKVGPGLIGKLVMGKRVAVINSDGGDWAESVIIPAKQARPVPADLPDEQAASFFVNPMTVVALVRHVLRVPRGAWLLQSAANSSLGKMIIKLGRHDDFRTLNVVRRHELVEELKGLGADEVIVTSDGPIEEQVRRIVGGDGVRYALDPVGGEIGSALFRALGGDGELVVYGSLTGEPIEIPPRLMISAKRRVRGFWLGHWMRERSIPEALLLFRQVGGLIRSGVLATESGPRFPLERVSEAVVEAEKSGKPGKVLLVMGQGGATA